VVFNHFRFKERRKVGLTLLRLMRKERLGRRHHHFSYSHNEKVDILQGVSETSATTMKSEDKEKKNCPMNFAIMKWILNEDT